MTIVYFALGFFNILFAWLGMIDFLLPLVLAIFGGNKFFCNRLCGRGQLFHKLGCDLKCSRNRLTPGWLSSKWFRYGFLAFFPDDVWKYGLPDLSGGERVGHPCAKRFSSFLDLPDSMGLDLYPRNRI